MVWIERSQCPASEGRELTVREVFYREDPTWFFEDDEIGKTQHAPEYYELDQRERYDLAPDIHCVFRTHCLDGVRKQDLWQSSNRKESVETYKLLRSEIMSKGFRFIANADNL